MVRIDMSEYMEKHAVARLIGAPPGYVGYEEGGQLTEAVRRRPYSVILFDEIEKAHPDVFNILLQILDDGRLTDSQGRTVDFRNTVIIMTSNIGSHVHPRARRRRLGARRDAGHAGAAAALQARVPQPRRRHHHLPAARHASRSSTSSTCSSRGSRSCSRSGSSRSSSRPRRSRMLAEEGYDPAFGARPLKRAIQRLIQNPLALQLLEGRFQEGDHIVASGHGRGGDVRRSTKADAGEFEADRRRSRRALSHRVPDAATDASRLRARPQTALDDGRARGGAARARERGRGAGRRDRRARRRGHRARDQSHGARPGSPRRTPRLLAHSRGERGRSDSWRLDDCTLYVTLEPCAMCAGALVLARVDARGVRRVGRRRRGWPARSGTCCAILGSITVPRCAAACWRTNAARCCASSSRARRGRDFVDTPSAAG